MFQSKGKLQKVDNERYLIDVSDKIAGNWCIYDKESNDSFTFYPMSTSIQTDVITKSVLNDKYSIEVHAYTGIECLKVKGEEGNGSWLMMSNDQQQLDKLQVML